MGAWVSYGAPIHKCERPERSEVLYDKIPLGSIWSCNCGKKWKLVSSSHLYTREQKARAYMMGIYALIEVDEYENFND